MASKLEETKSLSTVFKEGLDMYNNLGKIDEPTNSLSVQINIKKAMHSFEAATRLVSLTDLFSKNESIDEIATDDLQYMLLPAFLGSLSLKLTTGERKDIIDTADVYFKDYLQRCNNYGLSNYAFKEPDVTSQVVQIPESQNNQFEQIRQSVNTRASKIQRFREQKELQAQLAILKQSMDSDLVDDEIKRKYNLNMIKLFIYDAMDELSSIEMEKPILEHMSKMVITDKPKQRRPVQPLKPIIITRDEMQKAVYGAGYPSLPTMTVQEFYDKRVLDGVFPDPTKPRPVESFSMQEAALAGISLNDSDKEDEDKEHLEEVDDDENIARLRAKDEFKDEHRRGWGNRNNRS